MAEPHDPVGAEGAARLDRSLLLAILESTADGILVIDLAGRVVVAKEAFRRLWRIPDDLRGAAAGPHPVESDGDAAAPEAAPGPARARAGDRRRADGGGLPPALPARA